MATIDINISCEPHELGDVLENIRLSFQTSASDAHDPTRRVSVTTGLGDYAGGPLTLNEDAFLAKAADTYVPTTPSAGVDPEQGAEGAEKKRVRRTKAQIAEDNERQAQIDAARKAAVEAGTPSVNELKAAEANPTYADASAAQDITYSLFSVGTPGEASPPKSDPVVPASDGAPEVTFESLQTFVVKLGKEYKVQFPKITEALGKHLAAAGVTTARELTGTQRAAALQDLLALHPGATL